MHGVILPDRSRSGIAVEFVCGYFTQCKQAYV